MALHLAHLSFFSCWVLERSLSVHSPVLGGNTSLEQHHISFENMENRDGEAEDGTAVSPPFEFESPNVQNQLELTSMATINQDSDPSIITKDEQHAMEISPDVNPDSPNCRSRRAYSLHSGSEAGSSSEGGSQKLKKVVLGGAIRPLASFKKQILGHNFWSHSYSNPKQVAYLLSTCLPFFTFVSAKLMWEGHSHSSIANNFMVISTVAYVMAFLVLCILFWIYEHLEIPNSPHHNTYLRYFRILKDVCYILYVLILLSLLVVVLLIFLLHPDPDPDPRPQTHPWHHPDPQTHTNPRPGPQTRHDPQTCPDPRPQTHPWHHSGPQTRTDPRPGPQTRPDPRPQTLPDPRPDPQTHPDHHPDPQNRPDPDLQTHPRTCPNPQSHLNPRLGHSTFPHLAPGPLPHPHPPLPSL
ncbi:hypothetical protein L1987_59649 [Smallanthus sonchifolius]|uniref:Uncharacterized protein n=1 Tax=Smallanthus sonchifolius TaxID=185202 RepID=A0ACB9D635_9ASTR|nr:hypothetical protein L1987_59649 [Smallanthus sonchifolius]